MQIAGKTNSWVGKSFVNKVITDIAHRHAPVFGQFDVSLRVDRVGAHPESGFIATRLPKEIEVV